jgi:beta-glucosidase
VNPSGHLPVTFYESEAQLPRPVRPGGKTEMDVFTINYSEGAAVGYKWVDRQNLRPLFPFGHGLSYTTFAYGAISATAAGTGGVHVRFTLSNVGQRRGMAVGQIYAAPVGGGWESPKRLVGFAKADLAPGQTKTVDIDVDPRLLSVFDDAAHSWRIAGGQYRLMLGASSADLRSSTLVTLAPLSLPSNWSPAQPAAGPAPMHAEQGR